MEQRAMGQNSQRIPAPLSCLLQELSASRRHGHPDPATEENLSPRPGHHRACKPQPRSPRAAATEATRLEAVPCEGGAPSAGSPRTSAGGEPLLAALHAASKTHAAKNKWINFKKEIVLMAGGSDTGHPQATFTGVRNAQAPDCHEDPWWRYMERPQ